MAAHSSSTSACGRCRAQIVWAVLPSGKRMPLDPTPNDSGNVAAYRDGAGGWRAHVLSATQTPEPYEKRYLPHFATCAPTVAHRQGVRDGSVIELSRARRQNRTPRMLITAGDIGPLHREVTFEPLPESEPVPAPEPTPAAPQPEPAPA